MKTSIPLICFGSSLTASAGQAEGDKWVTRLHFHLHTAWPDRFRLFNRGIGGNTTGLGLDRIDKDVLPLMPGWVIIGFGGNDSSIPANRIIPRVSVEEFDRNIRELCRLILESKGKPILMNYHLPVSPKANSALSLQGNGKTHAENLQPYHEVTRKYAEGSKIPLIDIPKIMERAKIKSSEIVVDDGIHLNVKGNHFYAKEIAEFFRNFVGISD